MLHSPLPRVLVAGVEGGASPLVPPPCPSPSSHQRSVFDSTPFPESSSQVGKLLRFEERSKERHERLKQEGVGGWIRDPIYSSSVTDSWPLCLAGLKSEEDWAVLFSFFSGGRIAQRAFCTCSSTYLGLGWVGVRRRQTTQIWGLQGEIW